MARIALALFILVSPAAAFAACSHSADQQAMSCVEGQVWDTEASACVPVVTG